jgi:phosphoadenosine phosphosulfate reductase
MNGQTSESRALLAALPPLAPGGPVLEDRLEAARAFLRAAALAAGPRRVAVAWTGGKDSTLALWLWREVLAEVAPGVRPRAVNLDTGCKFPQVLALRDALARRWSVDLHVARPEVDLDAYPVAADKVACCRDLKVRPLAAAVEALGLAVLVTGVRADEHPARAARPAAEAHADPPHLRLAPLWHFSEFDVWAATLDLGLPFCSLYGQGYRSLGCMPCTALPDPGAGERSGRDQDKERHMETLRSLGYF